jgi:methionine aminotransferase
MKDCRAFFTAKRDLLRAALAGTPSTCCRAAAASARHMRASARNPQPSSQRLVREYGVATIPLSAFYQDGTDHRVIRFCFAKRDETIHAAAQRLRGLRGAD